jgi:hypothetical protein
MLLCCRIILGGKFDLAPFSIYYIRLLPRIIGVVHVATLAVDLTRAPLVWNRAVLLYKVTATPAMLI